MQIHRLSCTWLGTPFVLGGLLLAGLFPPAAQALQRVTLRNGFSYDCARYETIDSSHIRLYLTPRSDNFIDLSRQSIASIVALPDPPSTLDVPQPGPAASTTTLPLSTEVPQLVSAAAHQHHIDAALLASIIQAESGGHPRAVSRTGARGLMQLMPGTAQQLGVSDAFRPDQNIAGGTTYLDQLLDRYDAQNDTHGLALALAAYNAGPAAVDRYHGIPPFRETRAYVVRVLNEFKRRKLALQHLQSLSSSGNPASRISSDIASLGAH